MKRIFTALIFLGYFLSAAGQERIGIANSNYSSINSIFLNPSSSVDSRTLLQCNLLGVNIFAMNNQVCIPRFNVWGAAKGNVNDPKAEPKGIKGFAYFKAELNAPSIVVSNQEIGAGLFARARVEVAANNIPEDFIKMAVENKIDTMQLLDINIRNTRISEMSWVEYGANFGMMYFKHSKTLITIGGNAKYITGVNLAYGNIYRLNSKINGTQYEIYNVNAKARYNEPAWKSGKGFGFDLGFTYKKALNFVESYYANSPKSGCKYIDYQYKIGASLLDVGAVRFAQNTYKNEVSGSSTIYNFENVDFDSIMRADFNYKEEKDAPIWATLPTAFSIQGDLNLTHHFYVNATIVQGITGPRMVGVQHANSLSITPRFETRNIEFAVPLTFYRYIYPQLGAAIRFRTFVLGMDNILPLIARTNTYGGNIYFNLGFSIFKNPKCKKSRARYTPTKKNYEGYTFLSLKNKKRTIMANGQGEAPEGFSGGKRTKGSKQKKEKKRGIIRRKSQKL